MDYLKTADTTTGAIGSTTVGGGTRTGLLVDGTSPLNASKNWAQYYNMLIEENVYVIEQAGLIPDKNNWHQMSQAISIIAETPIASLSTSVSTAIQNTFKKSDFSGSYFDGGFWVRSPSEQSPNGYVIEQSVRGANISAEISFTVLFPVPFTSFVSICLCSFFYYDTFIIILYDYTLFYYSGL
jgi:hypothetical protein